MFSRGTIEVSHERLTGHLSMIELPFFSKFLSSRDCLAFGEGGGNTVPPVLRTVSSLARVIASPAASRAERKTAARLIRRALEKARWVPKYPSLLKPPLRPVRLERLPARPVHCRRAVPLIVGTKTPARQRANLSTSGSSVRPCSLQSRGGPVSSRWMRSSKGAPERRLIAASGTFHDR